MQIAASFVAGCALHLGVLTKPGRWIKNPEYETAAYEVVLVTGKKVTSFSPIVRTNDPRYLTSGSTPIPEFIYG